MIHDQLYIVWSEEYEIGVPIVDEQHRGVVTAINTLEHAMATDQAGRILEPVLATLGLYTRIHFFTEEGILERTGYPELTAHRAVHARMVSRTRTLLRECRDVPDPAQALEFLREWWLGHILEQDRAFGEQVRSHRDS